MSERYDKDEFRLWLTSFEPDEQPFQQRCPIATWQQKNGEFELYLESLCSDWMAKFIVRIDESWSGNDEGPDWSMLTAKDALGVLDSLELAS